MFTQSHNEICDESLSSEKSLSMSFLQRVSLAVQEPIFNFQFSASAPINMKSFRAWRSFSTGRGGISGPKIDGRPRFYQSVQVEHVDDDDYRVTLDGKRMKTPMKTPLSLPTVSLAYAIAHEWDIQGDDGIRPKTMPLMALASTCADGVDARESTIMDVLQYLKSDTLCFEALPREVDELRAQRKLWTGHRTWFEEQFKGTLDVNRGLMVRLQHSSSLLDNVKEHLQQMDLWALMALRIMTRDCKSLILAMAVVHRQCTAQEAIAASRVEEEGQIDRWGLVEGGHDIDRANIQASVSSASSFLWLLTNRSS